MSKEDLLGHLSKFGTLFLEKGIPSPTTWGAYFAFFFIQLLLAAYMPGLTMYGLPTADGTRLPYHCNGYLSYYFCLFGALFAHFSGIFPLTHIADNFGEYLVASIIIADATTVFWYLYGIYWSPNEDHSTRTRMPVYDFFMGTVLYPRITFFPNSFAIDIKMIAECRWSWLTLMLLTTSCALKMYETTGTVTKEMGVMLLAHWLYSNATVKGEHCIPCTWDMFHEKFGWMLNFWNIAGVPFLYCFQSFYVLKNHARLNETLPIPFIIFVYALLVLGYYVFDTANCQKASDKVKGVRRNTFPQLPWSILSDSPRYIETPKGNLLVDGWYAHVRKMQYTGDITMALCWGFACGFESPLPYFYALFFTCMIVHRQTRDEVRCKAKYGKFWDIYTKEVPNVFLPGPSFFLWLLKADKTLPPVDIPPEMRQETRAAQEAKALQIAQFKVSEKGK